MANEVQQLRELIELRLVKHGRASLVEVLAEFDCRNHALPSAWKWRQAFEQLTPLTSISEDCLHLELSATPAEPPQLPDDAIARIVELYRRSASAQRQ